MSKYNSPFSIDYRNPVFLNKRDPRARDKNFQEYYSKIGREVIINEEYKIKNLKSVTSNITDGSEPTEGIPAGGIVYLTGGSAAGVTIIGSTTGWTNSPSSYDVFITKKIGATPTSTDTKVAESFGQISAIYQITSSDVISQANFKAFATASNITGTSTIAESINTITAGAGAEVPTTAPVLSINGDITIDGVYYNADGYAYVDDEILGSLYQTSVAWTAVDNSPTFYEWQVFPNSTGTMSGINYGLTDNVLSATSSWLSAQYGTYASWRVRGGNENGTGPWSNIIII